MTSIKASIKRRPVLTHYILTFAISWGGVLLVVGGPGGIPGAPEELESLLPIAIVAMLAVPRLRLRYSILTSGLIVGVLWGAWHLLTNDFWASRVSSGDLPLPLFVTVNGFGFLVGQLLAYRVLMVWIYDRTGSLLVAMLMHASLTASTFILGPLAISGGALLIYGLGLAAAMWVVVAAVALANGGQFSRQPIGRVGT